ncbi:MAG TPA: BTAD domain-containing putative transcriptional regulator [Nitriliruptorales bacterium]
MPVDPTSETIGRPRLERMLDSALTHRVTLVLGDAGFGKTTLLDAWSAGINAVRHVVTAGDADPDRLLASIVSALRLRLPELPATLDTAMAAARGPSGGAAADGRMRAMAGAICAALAEQLTRDLVLVIEDVDQVADASGIDVLLPGLVQQSPPLLHLVFAARREPPVGLDRIRAADQVLVVSGRDLLFTPEETAQLLREVAGVTDAGLAREVHQATGGWAAALRLAVTRLASGVTVEPADVTTAVASSTRQGFEDLIEDLHADLDPAQRDVLATCCRLQRVCSPLLAHLGHDDPDERVAELARLGLVLEPAPRDPGWFVARDIARSVLDRLDPSDDESLRRLRVHAADWLLAHGLVTEALAELTASRDVDAIIDLLHDLGAELAEAGAARDVLAAVDVLPGERRDRQVELVAGIAAQLSGDWDLALDCFERAARDGRDPELAWRQGLIHHLRSDLETAIAIYGDADETDASMRDLALLHSWHATAWWLRGDAETCRRLATTALDEATQSGDPQALAAAHTVMAMVAALEGDRRGNDAHYLRALDHAERARDPIQIIRVRTNRASHHLEEGRYSDALAELEPAIELADLTGFTAFGGIALCNRAEAWMHLGELEQANADLRAALAHMNRIESGLVSYPLGLLGQLHRMRGDDVRARIVLDDAIAICEPAGDVQGLVPALAELARLLAEDEPDEAAAVAERALAHGSGLGHVDALLARAAVHLAAGEPEDATRVAGRALELSRDRRDPAGQAKALELLARAAEDDTGADLVEAAIGLWQQTGDRPALARARLLATRWQPEATRGDAARAAEEALVNQGLAVSRADLEAAMPVGDGASAVSIETLGAFRVRRAGVPVPGSAWRSRKARDLLRMLVARRGRPLPRDAAMDVLWPDEAGEKVANRFNVALSTVRSVLDPERVHPADHFVSSVDDSVAVDVTTVAVDLETFHVNAEAGLAAWSAGDRTSAEPLLEAAAARYRGDFLESSYDDWAVAPREDARAVAIEVGHALADLASGRDEPERAARHLLRVLERDEYDERAHLGLVRAWTATGRHGEARRAYLLYVERMRELNLSPEPFPAEPGIASGLVA